jgi:hypothetical protein
MRKAGEYGSRAGSKQVGIAQIVFCYFHDCIARVIATDLS